MAYFRPGVCTKCGEECSSINANIYCSDCINQLEIETREDVLKSVRRMELVDRVTRLENLLYDFSRNNNATQIYY
jgi:threonine synthase